MLSGYSRNLATTKVAGIRSDKLIGFVLIIHREMHMVFWSRNMAMPPLTVRNLSKGLFNGSVESYFSTNCSSVVEVGSCPASSGDFGGCVGSRPVCAGSRTRPLGIIIPDLIILSLRLLPSYLHLFSQSLYNTTCNIS